MTLTLETLVEAFRTATFTGKDLGYGDLFRTRAAPAGPPPPAGQYTYGQPAESKPR